MRSTKIAFLIGLALGGFYALHELRDRENIEPSARSDESAVVEAIKPVAIKANRDKKSGARIPKKKKIKKRKKARQKATAHAPVSKVSKKIKKSIKVGKKLAAPATLPTIKPAKVPAEKPALRALPKTVGKVPKQIDEAKEKAAAATAAANEAAKRVREAVEVAKQKASVARQLAKIDKSLKKLKKHKKSKKISEEIKHNEALFDYLKKSPPKDKKQKKRYRFLFHRFTKLKEQKMAELAQTKEARIKARVLKSIRELGSHLARIRNLSGTKKQQALKELKPKVDALATLSIAKTDLTVKKKVGALTTGFLAMQPGMTVEDVGAQPSVPIVPTPCKKETCTVVRDQQAWRLNCDCGSVLGFNKCQTSLAYYAKGYQYDVEGQTKTSHLICKPPMKDKLPGGTFPDTDCDYSSCRLMMDTNTYDFFNLVCTCKGKEYTFDNIYDLSSTRITKFNKNQSPYGACPTKIVYNEHWASKLNHGLTCDGPKVPYASVCNNCILGNLPFPINPGVYSNVYCSDCTDPKTKTKVQGAYAGLFIVSENTQRNITDCKQLTYCGANTLECKPTCQPLPEGPYKDQCSNCAVLTDGSLYCVCNGETHQLDGNVATCKNDYGSAIDLVTLKDGTKQLRCTPPSGTYLSTCIDCYLVADQTRNFTQLMCTECANKNQVKLILENAPQCKKDNKDILDCTGNNCKLVCGSSCSGCSCKDDWPFSGPQFCQCSSDSDCDRKCAGQHLPGGGGVPPGGTGVCKCEPVAADGAAKYCVYGKAPLGQYCPALEPYMKKNKDNDPVDWLNWSYKYCDSRWKSLGDAGEEFLGGLICAKGDDGKYRCMDGCTSNDTCKKDFYKQKGWMTCRYNNLSYWQTDGQCGPAVPEGGRCYGSNECEGELACRDVRNNQCNSYKPASEGGCDGSCQQVAAFGESCQQDGDCRYENEIRCIQGKCRYKCKSNSDCKKDGTVPASSGWTTCHWDMKDSTGKYGHCASPRAKGDRCYDSMECAGGGKCAYTRHHTCPSDPNEICGTSMEPCDMSKEGGCVRGFGTCQPAQDIGQSCQGDEQCKSGYCAILLAHGSEKLGSGICLSQYGCDSDSDCKGGKKCFNLTVEQLIGSYNVSACIDPLAEGRSCTPGTCADGLTCVYGGSGSGYSECTERGKCLGVCVPSDAVTLENMCVA